MKGRNMYNLKMKNQSNQQMFGRKSYSAIYFFIFLQKISEYVVILNARTGISKAILYVAML